MAIATSSVEIVADTAAFRSSAARDVQAATRGQQVSIAVVGDTTRFRAQLVRDLKDLPAVQVGVVPDTVRFRTLLEAQLSGLPSVQIALSPDMARFRAELEAAVRAMPPVPVPIGPSGTPTPGPGAPGGSAPAWWARIRNATNDLDGFNTALGRIGVALRGLSAFTGILMIGAQAASAVGSVISLVDALAPLAGLLAAVPAAAALGGAALATLKLATDGLGKAFGTALTGNAKDFQKALQDLSPAAQAAALQIRTLQPAFESLKNSVQSAFLTPLTSQFAGLGPVISGTLLPAMRGVATEFGLAGRAVLQFAQQSQTAAAISAVFATLRGQLSGLVPAIQPVLVGLRSITVGVLPFFDQLGSSVASTATRFGTWLAQVGKGGQALAWAQNGLAVLEQLGTVLRNVGGILQSVFSAGVGAGGSMLGLFGQVTAQLNTFLRSAQGAALLAQVFQGLGQAGSGIGPILGGIVQVLAALAPTAGRVAAILGPALGLALNALAAGVAAAGPGLVAFAGALALALGEVAKGNTLTLLGQAFSQLVIGVAPLIPDIIQLAVQLVPLVAGFVNLVAPAGEFIVILIAVGAAVGPVVTAITTMIAVLEFVASPIGIVVVAIALLVAGLVYAYVHFQTFRTVVNAVFGFVGSYILATIHAVVAVFGLLQTGVGATITWFSQVPATLAAAWGVVAGFFSGLWRNVTSAFSTGVAAVLGFFSALPGQALAALAALPQLLWSAFTGALSLALQAVGAGIALIVFAITQLPGLAIRGLASLGQLLWSVMTSAWNLGTQAVSAGVSATVNFFEQLPGRAMGALSSLGSMLYSLLTGAWRLGNQAVSSGVSATVSFFQQLPSRAASALSSLGSMIGGAFTSAFHYAEGLVTSGINAIASGFRSLPGLITGALSGIGNGIWGGLQTALNWGISAINKVISGYNAVAGKLPGMSKIGEIPKLANGAIVTRPQIALIAEAGREVVIPLTRPNRARELADRSGLTAMLGSRRDRPAAPTTIHNTFQLHTAATQPDVIAHRMAGAIAAAAGV
ncbi:phage tail protein [Streptacidiphilus cavernicola]|uniref:Tape measure protein n=1 Tax=Streptacidiphilus cavernicola TaxID=3342716 RepID=A0ABV6VYA4_9ACTN